MVAVANCPSVGAHAAGEQDRTDRVIVFHEQAEIAVRAAGEAAAVGGAGSGVEAIFGEVAVGATEIRAEAQHVSPAHRRPDFDFAA